MLEPVEIDINMNQNVSEEASKAAVANEEMTKSVEAMQKEIERLNKVVQDMSTALTEQRKLTADSAGSFDNATKKIDAMQAAVDQAKQELTVYQTACEQMNTAVQKGADVTDVLTDAKKSLADTEGTLISSAKELIGNQQEINHSLGEAGKSTDTYTASNKLLSATLNSIAQNLGLENTAIRNAITNVNVIAAAKRGWTEAVKILNTHIGLTVTQSKLLLGVGLATGLGAIVGAIALLVTHFKNLHEEQEEVARLNKIVTDSLKSAASEGEKAAKKETVALKLLYNASQNEANSKQDRIRAANELQRLYPQYFANLTQEEILAGRGADAYDRLTDSIIASARARAAKAKIEENETKIYELEEKRIQAMADKEAAESKIDIAGYKYNPQNAGGNPYAANAMNRQRGKEISEANAEMEEYNKTIWQTTKEIGKYNEANRKLAERVGVDDLIGKGGKTPKTPKTPADTTEKEQQKAYADLEKKAYDYQRRIDAARVKAIHEGAEQERQAAKAEYDRTKAYLEQEYKNIAELEQKTGQPATEQRTLLLSLDIEATRQYEAETARINVRSKETIDSIFAEVNSKFRSELDNNQLQINQYYNNLIREVSKVATDVDKFDLAEKMANLINVGNVDLLSRPLVDAAELVKKGWEDAGEGIATVFSSQYGITDSTGKEIEILVTPILADGSILSQNELEDYIDEILNGAEDILTADNKGIVIAVDIDKDANIGEQLHLLQEQYYQTSQKIETINALNTMRAKELVQASIDNELSLVAFEEEIATRRLEIADKNYIFQADREKDLLEVSLKAARKRQELLMQSYNNNPTEEMAESLRRAGLEVDALTGKIKKLPSQKFSEILGIVNRITDSIGTLAGTDLSILDNVLSGINQFEGKDFLGAASSGLGVVTGLLSGILNKGAREAEIRRELLRLQQEYNITLRQQNYDLIQSIDYARAFRNNMEALYWLVEKGFISDVDYSAWEALDAQWQATNVNIGASAKEMERLEAEAVSFFGEVEKGFDNGVGSMPKKVLPIINDWKNGVTDTVETLKRLAAVGLTGPLLEQLENATQETEKWKEQIVEISRQMDEFATGTSFDGFLSSSMSAIESLMTGVSELGDFTEDTLRNAVLSSFKYKVLANALEPLYNQLADIFLADEIDANAVQSWSDDFNQAIQDASEKLGITMDALGLDLENSAGRTGATGGFATASQDSINELTGGVYAVRQMVGDIRNDNREELLVQRTIIGQLSVLVERSEYWMYLEELPAVVQKLEDIETYGLKMKV